MYSAYEALQQSRNQAYDLSTRIGRQRLGALLEKADRELSMRLHQDAYLRSSPGSFTAVQMRATLAQIRAVTASVTHGMERILHTQANEATDKAVGNIVEYMNVAEKTFKGVGAQPLALREVEMLHKVSQGVNSSLLRRLASSGEDDGEPHPGKLGVLQRYGLETIETFEESLQQGMVQRKSWAEVRGDITADSTFLQGAPASWAERIVRTESMGAYNRAGWETIRAADDTLGDMCKILSATFDDRTGWDSYQVHGQIRLPDQAFEWLGGFYAHPPNRPNDRETIVPHRISWALPGYLRQRTDEEVMRRYQMQRKTGIPGPRPKMTTVPLHRFGSAASTSGSPPVQRV